MGSSLKALVGEIIVNLRNYPLSCDHKLGRMHKILTRLAEAKSSLQYARYAAILTQVYEWLQYLGMKNDQLYNTILKI